MQHNPLLWEVKGKHFVYEKGLTKGSKNLNTAVRLWLNQLSMEERAEFVDALFDIVQATGAMTVNELSQNKLSLANDMIKSYKNMDPVAKDHLKNVLKKFFEKSQQLVYIQQNAALQQYLRFHGIGMDELCRPGDHQQ